MHACMHIIAMHLYILAGVPVLCAGWGRVPYMIVPSALSHVGRNMLHTITPSALYCILYPLLHAVIIVQTN